MEKRKGLPPLSRSNSNPINLINSVKMHNVKAKDLEIGNLKAQIENNFNILEQPSNVKLNGHNTNLQMQVDTLTDQVIILEKS
jgi:hypothetical protein